MTQAEGGEQENTLMLLVFSIGIQGGIGGCFYVMRRDEQNCAFLDDLYIVCQPERVRVLYDLLSESLIRVAGIHFHERKARVWNASGKARQRCGVGSGRLAAQRNHSFGHTHRFS